MKKCIKCNQILPATDEFFYKQKQQNKENGIFYILTAECKECRKLRSKNYWEKNIEYYQKRNYEYYKDNKESINENVKIWIKNNKKRHRKYYKNYQQNNKDKFNTYSSNRQHNKIHKISEEEWKQCKLYFNNSCAYCGITEEEAKIKYNNYLHKEHVDHNGSNDLSNCIPSCKSCNSQKWEYKLEDWYNSKNDKYSSERYVKITKWIKNDYKLYKGVVVNEN